MLAVHRYDLGNGRYRFTRSRPIAPGRYGACSCSSTPIVSPFLKLSEPTEIVCGALAVLEDDPVRRESRAIQARQLLRQLRRERDTGAPRRRRDRQSSDRKHEMRWVGLIWWREHCPTDGEPPLLQILNIPPSKKNMARRCAGIENEPLLVFTSDIADQGNSIAVGVEPKPPGTHDPHADCRVRCTVTNKRQNEDLK